MTTNHKFGTLILVLLLAGSIFAQEKRIKRSELPEKVEKTVVDQSRGATIRGFSQETENGRTTYEVEFIVNGHSKDVEMDSNGGVLEVEEQVDLKSLPADVRTGLQASARKGTLTKIESITKKDKVVAYEAQIERNGKKSEVQVGPKGQPLDHEE